MGLWRKIRHLLVENPSVSGGFSTSSASSVVASSTSGAAHLQFEDRLTAEAEWVALGLDERSADGKEYPRDMLDGLITQERIYTIVPSDEYP